MAEVVIWLQTVSGIGLEKEQLKKLNAWAQAASPLDHKAIAIRGFGLAGYQYLRMLFGANTTKPDQRICEFVESHLRRKVTPFEALQLLESAAAVAKVSLRDLDTTVWEERARRSKT